MPPGRPERLYPLPGPGSQTRESLLRADAAAEVADHFGALLAGSRVGGRQEPQGNREPAEHLAALSAQLVEWRLGIEAGRPVRAVQMAGFCREHAFFVRCPKG